MLSAYNNFVIGVHIQHDSLDPPSPLPRWNEGKSSYQLITPFSLPQRYSQLARPLKIEFNSLRTFMALQILNCIKNHHRIALCALRFQRQLKQLYSPKAHPSSHFRPSNKFLTERRNNPSILSLAIHPVITLMVQSHWLTRSAGGRARIPMQGVHSSLRFVSETCTPQNRRSVPWPAVSVTMGTSTHHARCCPSQSCFSSACLSCHAAVIFPWLGDVTELAVWTTSAGNVAVRALALSGLAILQSITITRSRVSPRLLFVAPVAAQSPL